MKSHSRRLHTEIPDIIQPFKRYDSDTIQAVIDNNAQAQMCAADTSTMNRWKASMSEAAPDIAQRFVSVIVRETDKIAPVITADKILERTKELRRRWLAFVMATLVNCGHKLRARFAFCQRSFPRTVFMEADRNCGKGKNDVEKVKDSG